MRIFMDKREIFEAKKEQGEKELKEIREAAKSADSDAKLAEKKDAIEAIKVKTRGKLKELKASKRTRYSMAKKEANKRWDDSHKDQKRYITYRSRAKRFIQMASEADLKDLDNQIHAKLN